MTNGPRTMLGFPSWPAVDSDPRRLSTGIDELDRRLVRWLDARQGERDMRREGDRCVLVDRGHEMSLHGEALGEATAYEDSVRKTLQVALDADFFETRTGRRPTESD